MDTNNLTTAQLKFTIEVMAEVMDKLIQNSIELNIVILQVLFIFFYAVQIC